MELTPIFLTLNLYFQMSQFCICHLSSISIQIAFFNLVKLVKKSKSFGFAL